MSKISNLIQERFKLLFLIFSTVLDMILLNLAQSSSIKSLSKLKMKPLLTLLKPSNSNVLDA